MSTVEMATLHTKAEYRGPRPLTKCLYSEFFWKFAKFCVINATFFDQHSCSENHTFFFGRIHLTTYPAPSPKITMRIQRLHYVCYKI